jgi:hypothetical protein
VLTGSLWSRVGQNHIKYIEDMHGDFSREMSIHTVLHGAYIQFWPTLNISLISAKLRSREGRSIEGRAEGFNMGAHK